MRKQITGDKLERLNYLFENESNAKELSDALIAKSITGATATNVKEVGGSHLEYRFRLAADTETSWLKKRAIRITKKFIEDYNQALQEAYDAAVAGGGTPEEPDFDSDETHIAQATAWIRQSVKGTKHEIDSGVDKVEIVALSGKVDEANFLIEVQEAGLVADHGKKHQQRIKLERLNIADFIPEEGITVTTLDHAGAVSEILGTLNLPEALEGEEFEIRRLFSEDILLPMTHLKDSHRYVAVISSAALDYYGEIEFLVNTSQVEPRRVSVRIDPYYAQTSNIISLLVNVSGTVTSSYSGTLYYRETGSSDPYTSESFYEHVNGSAVTKILSDNENNVPSYDCYVEVEYGGETLTSDIIVFETLTSFELTRWHISTLTSFVLNFSRPVTIGAFDTLDSYEPSDLIQLLTDVSDDGGLITDMLTPALIPGSVAINTGPTWIEVVIPNNSFDKTAFETIDTANGSLGINTHFIQFNLSAFTALDGSSIGAKLSTPISTGFVVHTDYSETGQAHTPTDYQNATIRTTIGPYPVFPQVT